MFTEQQLAHNITI